jgi:GH35 family endo-1,4-beta-xylanase
MRHEHEHERDGGEASGSPTIARRTLLRRAPGVEEQVRRQEQQRPGRAREIMVDHIEACARRDADRMHSWNVVNEPIETTQGRPDGLRRESIWFEAMGPEYIRIALEAASRTTNEAGSNALLMVNEWGLEHGYPPWTACPPTRR